MSYRLQLLGGARLELDGTAVSGRAVQRRRLALLALLALAPRRTLTRERLVGFLWPDHAPDAARRLLSESVYVLRRELGDQLVVSVGDELTLDGSVSCDVDQFLRAVAESDAAAAMELYAGPLLDGWYVREAPEFERWSEGERVRLAGLCAKVIRTCAESCDAAGAWGDASTYWHALVRLDPYNSAAVFRAARALAMAGDRAAGLQTLSAHETILQRDLGVGLDAELTALAAKIRRGELGPARPVMPTAPSAVPALIPADSAGASSDVPSPPPGEAPRRTTSLRPAAFAVAIAMAGVLALAIWLVTTNRGFAHPLSLFRSGPPDAAQDALDRRRIAIMYFEDRSPARELAYLADGFTEYLIGELARLPSLHVLSPDAVRRFRGAPVERAIAQLGVRTIIEASVERSSATIRVAARIVDAKTGEQVGTLVVEAPYGETFALQDRLSAGLAMQLARWIGESIRVGEARHAARVGARNDHALDLVLRAERLRKDADLARVNAGKGAAAVDSARAMLRQADMLLADAAALDRTWALPSIERGWVSMLGGQLENGTARVVTLGFGLTHAERAIATLEDAEPRDSALLARALYLRGLLRVRGGTAVQTFRPESTMIRQGEDDLVQAVAYDPHLAGAWAALALPRWIRGDFAGVAEAATRALEVDAYLEDAADVVGWAWRAEYARGNRDAAEHWCVRGRQQMPEDWHFVECELTIMRLDVAGLSMRHPDPARAWAIVADLERIDPLSRARVAGHPYSPVYRQMIAAMVSAAAGDSARARATLAAAKRAVGADAELATDLLYETACLHFVLGERAEGEHAIAAYLKARPDMAGFIARDLTVRKLRGVT